MLDVDGVVVHLGRHGRRSIQGNGLENRKKSVNGSLRMRRLKEKDDDQKQSAARWGIRMLPF